jgi:hypothetical protein
MSLRNIVSPSLLNYKKDVKNSRLAADKYLARERANVFAVLKAIFCLAV